MTAAVPVATPVATPVAAWRDRWTGGRDGVVVLDLGEQPASDDFPPVGDPGPDPRHRLRMVLGSTSRLLQLEDDPTSPSEIVGVEPEALVRQAEASVADAVAAGLIAAGGTVLHYASPHGGSWRSQLAPHGLVEVDGDADLIVDVHGMMHDPDQRAGFAARRDRLAPDGVLLMLIHDAAAAVRQGMWSILKSGHFAYYTVPALVGMAHELGLVAIGAWRYPLYQHGTTMLAFVRAGSRRDGGRPDAVAALVAADEAAGVTDASRVAASLQEGYAASVAALRAWLDAARAAGLVVAGYGAASRTVALLASAGASPDDLRLVADAAASKQGRRMPGSLIPIGSPADLDALRPDRVLLFVADLLPDVRAALPGIEAAGGRWVIADPVPVEVDPVG